MRLLEEAPCTVVVRHLISGAVRRIQIRRPRVARRAGKQVRASPSFAEMHYYFSSWGITWLTSN